MSGSYPHVCNIHAKNLQFIRKERFLVKNSGKPVTLLAKGLLYCCVLAALIYATCFAASPQAFAANRPHKVLKEVTTPYSAKLVHPGLVECWTDPTTCDVFPAVSYGGSGCPDSGWNTAWTYDAGYFPYTITTGSSLCAKATWDYHSLSLSRTCYLYAYIPSTFATAQIAYGIYNASGRRMGVVSVDQNNYSSSNKDLSTWAFMGPWTGVSHISFSSNTGISGDYMAASQIRFWCF